MNFRSHLMEHIFIIATSIAMVVHTTWTFGTLFAGPQPIVYPGDISTVVAYLFWVTPALLVAIAIDVGQIQTSLKLAQSKNWKQQIALGITFLALALAGFYLQWFHLAHHIPALEFGAGLTPETSASLQGLKELAILIIPALLPLSTVLYTLSLQSEQSEHVEIEQVTVEVKTPPQAGPGNGTLVPSLPPYPDLPQIEEDNDDDLQDTEPSYPVHDSDMYAHLFPTLHESNQAVEDESFEENPFFAECPDCGWVSGELTEEKSIKYSLRAHRASCPARHASVE